MAPLSDPNMVRQIVEDDEAPHSQPHDPLPSNAGNQSRQRATQSAPPQPPRSGPPSLFNPQPQPFTDSTAEAIAQLIAEVTNPRASFVRNSATYPENIMRAMVGTPVERLQVARDVAHDGVERSKCARDRARVLFAAAVAAAAIGDRNGGTAPRQDARLDVGMAEKAYRNSDEVVVGAEARYAAAVEELRRAERAARAGVE